MYERILLPTDGSDSMDVVVDHVADIAGRRDATVHVCYVVDDRAFLTLSDEVVDDLLPELRAEGEAATERARERLEADGITVERTILRGDPAEEILAFADDHDVDLITMGTHGEAYERNILGSVSQKVVSRSSSPVLTVNVSDGDAD
jgi:nucleotide-binding universal stress UspA family protein